jgi:hypothetical protein
VEKNEFFIGISNFYSFLETNSFHYIINYYPIRRNMTDVSKYKSVAVKLPVWSKLQSFAQQDLRSVGKVIEWLADKEDKTRKKRKIKNGGSHA